LEIVQDKKKKILFPAKDPSLPAALPGRDWVIFRGMSNALGSPSLTITGANGRRIKALDKACMM